MAKIGYARVSTTKTTSRKAQHVENQEIRLRDHGCEIVFADKATGKAASRPNGTAACRTSARVTSSW